MKNRKVLLVEDEKDILDHFAAEITSRGYKVLTAENGAQAWSIFQGEAVLVVVTDITMPFKNGLEILRDIKEQSPATRVIVITGFGRDHAIQALKLDAFDYIEKGGSQTAEELLQSIERAFKDADNQIKVEREMLSFLTHTLFNSISGGPMTVDQVLESAHTALGDRYQEKDVYRMINNLASLKAIFISIANMLDAYGVFVNEPAAFEQRWSEDVGGELSLDHLFSAVLRQTISSILFKETNLEQLNNILASLKGGSIRQVRETFLKEVFWSEAVSHDPDRILKWIEQQLPVISLVIEDSNLGFNPGGVRYPFLFAIFSEIVYNALKYTDCREPIRIEWTKEGDTFTFRCSNTFSETSTIGRGSRKGLAFVNSLTRMIEGISMFRKREGCIFDIEIHLKDSLLIGGNIGGNVL